MGKLVTISVKIEQETLDRIDAFVENRRYWKRNTVIRNLLHALTECASEKVWFQLMCLWQASEGVTITVNENPKEDKQ